jgi:hypothetical protein
MKVNADEYRRYAVECLQLAETVKTQAKDALRAMAIAWNDLAERAERSALSRRAQPEKQDGSAGAA